MPIISLDAMLMRSNNAIIDAMSPPYAYFRHAA